MKLPSFSLPGSDSIQYTEKDLSVGRFIIYAYPKDMTPGCIIQAGQFEGLRSEFEMLDIKVFGISADSLESHDNFCEKKGLSFVLLSDPEKELLEPIGAWREKVNFGKRYVGIARSTYLVENGEIIKTWKAARANGNAQKVLDFWKKHLGK